MGEGKIVFGRFTQGGAGNSDTVQLAPALIRIRNACCAAAEFLDAEKHKLAMDFGHSVGSLGPLAGWPQLSRATAGQGAESAALRAGTSHLRSTGLGWKLSTLNRRPRYAESAASRIGFYAESAASKPVIHAESAAHIPIRVL